MLTHASRIAPIERDEPLVDRSIADDDVLDADVVEVLDLVDHGLQGSRRRGGRRVGVAVQPLAQLGLLPAGQRDRAPRVVGRALDEGESLQHRVVQVGRHRLAFVEADALAPLGGDSCATLASHGPSSTVTPRIVSTVAYTPTRTPDEMPWLAPTSTSPTAINAPPAMIRHTACRPAIDRGERRRAVPHAHGPSGVAVGRTQHAEQGDAGADDDDDDHHRIVDPQPNAAHHQRQAERDGGDRQVAPLIVRLRGAQRPPAGLGQHVAEDVENDPEPADERQHHQGGTHDDSVEAVLVGEATGHAEHDPSIGAPVEREGVGVDGGGHAR